ncbi:MAG TPA: menaquinone biosynthesis protein [Candidatus Angelobacter sp.]
MPNMPLLRISAISYLNTAPLMWDFENGEPAEKLKQHFQVSYTIPSQCADELKAGSADIGIIPAAAYTTIPDLLIIPDVAIACKNQVRSILLVSKVPLDKIRNVATDNSSRTSTALVQIFLRKFVGVNPGFTPQKPDLVEMLRWHDAGLLIGDVALQAQTTGLYVYDLAEEWRRWTYLPFVFAFWAVREPALEKAGASLNIARVFQQSRDNGLQHVAEIAKSWAGRLKLPEMSIHEYLTSNIDYSLDEENLRGLNLFYRYATECGVLPLAPELRFLNQAHAIGSLGRHHPSSPTTCA